MISLNTQVAIVTGATRGIGKAVTEKLVSCGATVVGLYGGNHEAAEQLLEQHKAESDRLELVQCNVADEEAVAAFFQQFREKYDRLDILVNNAGIRRDAYVAMMSSSDWQQVLDINLTGCYLMAKQAVLLMMEHKYGRIVNMTSPVAHLGFAGQANYAASKAGQVAFTKSLAKEIAKKKITVNCVSPGFIDTDFIADLGKDQLSAYKKMVPMRRFGTVEEVADSVLFLVSPMASYITGSVLEINGGL